MATHSAETDQDWGGLVALPVEERETKMLQRYQELGAMPEEERLARMLAMANAEYALADADLRTFTVSRLQVWIRLDPDVARSIVGAYEAAMRKLPGPQAMRRVSLVQTLAREFAPDVQQRLVVLVPTVFAGSPIATQISEQPMATQPAVRRARRGWWPFGKR